MPHRTSRSSLLRILAAVLGSMFVSPMSPVPARGDGTWIEDPPPAGRYEHAAVYDPLRDRMVVFGGIHGGRLDDTWTFSLSAVPKWTDLPGGRPPSRRSQHTAIYDPVRDRIVLFGGLDSTARNDVWELSLADPDSLDWNLIIPEGTPPSARYGHTAIYDSVRQRVVVFGGFDGALRNDVWALSLTGPGNPIWTSLSPEGTPPSARGGHTAIYDPSRDRMLVFGGGDNAASHNDVWELSLGDSPAWNLLPVGNPPPPRHWHTAIYDPANERMVVYGGATVFSNGTYSARNDVWALSLSGNPAWSPIPGGNLTSARYGHTAIYDPVRARMVVFGGDDGAPRNEVLALSFVGTQSWSRIDSQAARPGPRSNHTAIYDPDNFGMIVFGGDGGNNDVWVLSLLGDPAWNLLSPAGPLPSGRSAHSALHDPVRDRMIVFAGDDGFGLPYLNDVWTLTLADPDNPAWIPIVPEGNPPSGRYDHTAIYDPIRDRMVVFGGWDGTLSNEVWALSLAGNPAWNPISPAGTPPPPSMTHTAIYDPGRDRMVVFGGWDGISYHNDVWVLSLSDPPAWSELGPVGIPPSARGLHSAIYDPVRDRIVVFGGHEATERNDVWALSLSGTPSWSLLDPDGSPPSNRANHSAIYDPVRDRMVVFSGSYNFSFDDVHALEWGSPVTVSVPAAPRTASGLTRVLPNPASGSLVFEVYLVETRSAQSLSVYNVRGQLTWRVELRDLPAGIRRVRWDGRAHGGRRAPSGVYFARLDDVPAAARRFVLLD